MEFCKHFHPRGNVENWLLEVETTMKKSVKEVIREAVSAYHSVPRSQWVLDWPGQAVLTGSQMNLLLIIMIINYYDY